VVVVGGLVVAQRGSSAEAGYRTAVVASRPVDQTLARVGTIEPVAQASVGFPVGGTVAAVDVAVGDQVTVGQQLARLDTTSLDSTVADRQAALDQAELTLERALNGEAVSPNGLSDSATAATATPAAFFTNTSSGSSAVGSDDDPELAAAQEAVLAAQQHVDADLATAQQALDDAQAICAGLTAPEAAAASAAESPDTTGSTLPPGDPGDDGDVAGCQAALVAVLDAQQVVAGSQNALAEASRALDDLLAERAEDPGSGGGGNPGSGSPPTTSGTAPPTTAPSGAPQGTDGQAPSGSPSGSGTTGFGNGTSAGNGSAATSSAAAASPTAAELVAYQKAVDAAAAQLAVAEQAEAQATLVSPIAGTVQQVGVAAGDTVTAGSSTAAVVVVGDGGYEVTTTVTVDDLPDLAVGQAVTVTPDGTDDATTGELVRIGTVGTSSGSATTYPVTIGLTDPPEGLRNGATASLGIVTARSGDAVTVPTSAVTVDGGRTTVTVLDDGSPSEVTVQTGATGDVWTEITDGLDVGQTVVLADLDAPLPSSATDTETSGGFGNFGGPGGFRPGG
jgi:HlyD family secretion protein